jgi:hypothetical protein
MKNETREHRKEKTSVYIPPEILEACHREAARRNVSLSAYITEQLASTPSQIAAHQQWLSQRLDRLEASVGAAVDAAGRLLTAKAGDGLLAKAGLDNDPPELVMGALAALAGQLRALPEHQLKDLAAKGERLLARTNGAGK